MLTRDFVSHDFRLFPSNLRKECNPKKCTDLLDTIDMEVVTKCLMNILNIRNQEAQSIGITEMHIAENREYMAALDFIINCPIETAAAGTHSVEYILFTQPGMGYCQARALIFSLLKDEIFFRCVSMKRRW